MLKKFLFICLLTASFQYANGQSILDTVLPISIEGKSPVAAIEQISQQTSIKFAYSNNFFSSSQKVFISSKSTSLRKTLNELLKGTGISYKVIADQIVLFKLKNFTLSGYVTDKETGERLIGAYLSIPDRNLLTTTNEYGFFSITTFKSTLNLKIQYIGYTKNDVKVDLNDNISNTYRLTPNITLEEIIITPNLIDQENSLLTLGGIHELNTPLVKSVVSSAGNTDYINASSITPSVQNGNDGLGGLQVRGGNSAQNLTLIDGVPVYIPYHLFGITSIYNDDVIKSAKLLDGSFSSRYGGRLSSIIDVRTIDGNLNKFSGKASVNLISVNLMAEAPLVKNKSALVVATRFSHSDFSVAPSLKRIYFQDSRGQLNTSFYDLNVKWNAILSDKDRVYASVFTGKDELTHEDESSDRRRTEELEFDWMNTVGSFRWNHVFNPKLFLNTTATYSKFAVNYNSLDVFKNNSGGIRDLFFIGNRSENWDAGLKVDFDYIPIPKHTIKFGGGIARQHFSSDLTYFEEDLSGLMSLPFINLSVLKRYTNPEINKTWESNIYAEDKIQLFDKLALTLGARNSIFISKSQTFNQFEPRILSSYNLTSKMQIEASINKMIQNLHLISNSALRLPSDLWLPSSSNLSPQKAWHYDISYLYKIDMKSQFKLTGYLKKNSNLYSYPDRFNFLSTLDDNTLAENLTIGSSESKGLEFSYQYGNGKTNIYIAYTLSKNVEQFKEVNEGESYYSNNDQRHRFNITFKQKLGKHLSLAGQFAYNSPSPRLNLADKEVTSGLTGLQLYRRGEKNKERSSPYHRLDLNLTYTKQTKNLKHEFRIGAYNVYSRDNIVYYAINFQNMGAPHARAINGFSIMPQIYYGITF